MKERLIYEFYIENERFVTDINCPDGLLDDGVWNYIGRTLKKKRDEVLKHVKDNGIEKAKEKYSIPGR